MHTRSYFSAELAHLQKEFKNACEALQKNVQVQSKLTGFGCALVTEFVVKNTAFHHTPHTSIYEGPLDIDEVKKALVREEEYLVAKVVSSKEAMTALLNTGYTEIW